MDYKKIHEHIAKRYGISFFEGEIKEIVDIVLEMHGIDPEKCTMNPQQNPHDSRTVDEQLQHQAQQKGNQLDQVYGSMKEETAMQELIDDLREFRDEQTSPLVISTMNKVLLKASLLTTKEKEQMKRAFMEGALSWATGSGADDYYNETYGEQ